MKATIIKPKTPKRRKAQPDWDQLVRQFCCPDFIPDDPISFPHYYRQHSDDWRNVELAALIAALFSYGRRDKILETVGGIFDKLGPEPAEVLQDLKEPDLQKAFDAFYYRFNTAADLIFMLGRIGEIYRQEGSLKAFWDKNCNSCDSMQLAISAFRKAFIAEGALQAPDSYGMRFLFADPMQGSAAKRFNMFLRWMVRTDDVDLGTWSDTISPSRLMMPLDTHVAYSARKYGITQRAGNDWKTVEEITAFFRQHCPQDPVKYDFALFGLGILEKNA